MPSASLELLPGFMPQRAHICAAFKSRVFNIGTVSISPSRGIVDIGFAHTIFKS